MDKKVYINEEAKIVVVVLRNDEHDIIVRGKSKCHDDDTFDKELGIKLATTRAWINYYTKLRNVAKKDLDLFKDMEEYYSKRAEDTNKLIDVATSKYNEIYNDYIKTIETL